ncbi:hypothetical protein D3C86_1291410 [compost metagenome]
MNGLKASTPPAALAGGRGIYDETSRVAVAPPHRATSERHFRTAARQVEEASLVLPAPPMKPWNLRILDFTKSLNEVLPGLCKC